MVAQPHILLQPQRTAVRKGFALVELLVVIAIIAVLLGLLLPAISKAQEHSRLIACRSNLRTLGQAMFMSANDHHDLLPFDTPQGWGPGTGDGSALIAFALIWVRKADVFRCPADRDAPI